ncbi:MAG: LCP family protein [Candidatus Nanopelagicales bacterium]|nr:LCP family protein [Candidatus Nanopelagicales bacterium]
MATATHRRSGRKRGPAKTVAIVASAVVLAASGIGYAAASEVTGQVKHVTVFDGMSGRVPNDGGQNILLVGSDDRTGLSKAERKKLHAGQSDYGRHTDSMMIVHIADDGSVGVVSIPRDSYVEIPAYTDADGNTTAASKQKINAAYSIGGPQLAAKTVEQATGVHIDHYAEINFAGFVSMVDGLGGVPVCTKTAINDEKSGLNIPAGKSTLDGPQALAYVRARYFDPSADLGRMKRQQTFLASVFKQATSPAVLLNPVRLMAFFNAAAGSVTTDEGFNKSAMWGIAARMGSVSPSSISFQTVPIGSEVNEPGVGSVVTWDDAAASALFDKLKTGDALTGPAKAKSETVDVAPSMISVRTYNGSDVSGLGTKAGTDLRDAGFNVVGQAANAQTRTGSDTVIQYDPRYDVSLKTLQAALPNAKTQAVTGLGRTFKVIVGDSYNGVTAVTVAGASSDSSDKPKTAADDICG